MREISVNTALQCRSISLAVQPHQLAKGIDTEEVDGSNPFGPTIIFPGIYAGSPTSALDRYSCGDENFVLVVGGISSSFGVDDSDRTHELVQIVEDTLVQAIQLGPFLLLEFRVTPKGAE